MEFDERILEAAEQFFQAATDSGQELPHRPGTWLAFPEIVNYAFAAELALKGLYWLHHGKPSRGHDLHRLCFALPLGLVAELAARTQSDVLFDERLEGVRDAFERWRYAYEKEELTVSLDFLRDLAASAIVALKRDAPRLR